MPGPAGRAQGQPRGHADASAGYERLRVLRCQGPDADGVLAVTIDTGLAGNLVTAEVRQDLVALWPLVAADRSVRAVLLRGRSDGFSAGPVPDLMQSVVDADADRLCQLLEQSRAIALGPVDCAVPVVAAVRGTAVGALLGVALLCDVCVVGSEARLADGHARIGVVAGDHGVLIWPLLVGLAKAKRYLLLPEVLSGEEAERLGLVAEAVPDEDVDAIAEAYARRLALASPLAVQWTKRALGHWLRLGLPAFESSLAHELLGYRTQAAAEGVRSLREGRAPRFSPPGPAGS